MKLTIDTWKGISINDGTNYIADFPDGTPLVNSGSPLTVDLLDTASKTIGRRLTGPTVSIFVQPQNNYRSRREDLREMFRTEEEFTFYELIAHDEDDGDREWTIRLAPMSAVPMDDAFIVVLSPEDPYWYSDIDDLTHGYTASEESHDYVISTPSPFKVHPTMTLSIGAPKAGSYLYERWIPIKHAGIPTDIIPFDFGDGFDTAAYVLGGKMLASGYDCRLFINGFETPRWFRDFNTADTGMWGNTSFPAIKPLPLKANMLIGASPSSISFTDTPDNRKKFKRWGSSGDFVVGTEGFHYTNKDTVNLRVTGITRHIKETAATAHTAGDLCYYQPYDARLRYGNSAAEDPAYDDVNKPTLDLDESTNLKHVMTEFGSSEGTRYPKFAGDLGATIFQTDSVERVQGRYSGEEGTQISPYEVAGLSLASIISNGVWRSVSMNVNWLYHSSFRITSFSVSGKRYRKQAYWGNFVLTVAQIQTQPTTIKVITKPTVLNTWDSWTYSSGALSGKKYFVGFKMVATIPATADKYIAVEIRDATFNFNSADVPTCFHAPEADTYDWDLLIENGATNYALRIKKKTRSNSVIVIDTAHNTVKVDGVDSSGGVTPVNKRRWFEMISGTNPITLTDEGMGGVTLAIEGYAERTV